MSKIVEVANAMISNKGKISHVKSDGDTYFFLYDEKYTWSISYEEVDNNYYLRFYPGDRSIDAIIKSSAFQFDKDTKAITYSTRDLGTREAYNTFRDLYIIVKEKLFEVDKVFDDIIGDDTIPF
jgi:hypothetical protein